MYRILYVDDEQGLLEIAKLFLEQTEDFTVSTCASAEKTLSSGVAGTYDAIISDYQMPGMDGIGFLKAVRSQFGDIPFILFTGKGREEVVIQAINNGADFYIQKGGDPKAQFAELAHKVRQAVARRRAERSLVESEKRLADIINFLPDATFAIDRSGKVIAWNRAIEEMTGVPSAEIVGKGDYEYAIPFYGTRRKILIDLIFEPDEVIAKNYAHIFHDKDILIADTTLPRPMGRVVTLMGKASPLYNRKGEIIGAIESIRDISELKKAEMGLLRAKKDWETIFRAIGHPALVLNADNHIIDANDAAIRATGETLEQLKGKHCYEVFHGPRTAAPPVGCPFEKLRKTGATETSEMEVEALDGFFNVSCTPVFGADGQLEKVIHIAMDVSARRRAEDELRAAYEQIAASEEELRGQLDEIIRVQQERERSEKNFRVLVDNAPDAIYIQTNARFRYLNNAALKLLGATSAEELLGTDTFERIHPSFHECIRSRVKNLTVDLQPVELLEEVYVKMDGTSVDVEVTAVPFQYEGEHGALVMVRDITPRKQSENALRAAYEQLTASDEELRGQYEELALSEKRFRESEASIRSIFSAAPIGIGFLSGRNIVRVNDRLCEMTGYSCDEIRGRDTRFLYPDDEEYERVGRLQLESEKTDAPVITETRWKRKDGVVRYILLTGIPIDPSCPDEGRVYTALDITEEKKAHDDLRTAYEKIAASEEELRSQYEELARSERRVRESEEKYRTLVETANEGIWIIDSGFKTIFTNRKMQEILGYSGEEMLGRPVWDFVLPEETDEIKQSLLERQAGKPGHYERRWVRKDGTIVWCLTSGAPLSTTDGSFSGSFGMFTDISEKKERELALRQANLVVENSPAVLFRWKAEEGWPVAFVSNNVKRFGYTPEELLSGTLPYTAIVHPDDLARVGEEVERYSREGTDRFRQEYRIVARDGRVFWVDDRTTVERDRNGQITHYQGILIDITEQKQLQDQIRESEEKYRTLVEQSRDGIFIAQDATVVFHNPAFACMTGYSDEELAGCPISDLIAPEDRELVLTRHKERTRGKALPEEYEFSVLHRDGTTRILVRMTVDPIPWNCRPATIGTLHNITEDRKRETTLRESEEKYRALVETTNTGFVILDGEGRVIDANAEYVRLTGHDSLDAIRGRSVLEWTAPHEKDRNEAAVRQCIRDGHIRNFEVEYAGPDGEMTPVEINATVLSSGESVQIITLCRDISDRRRDQAVLQESEERTRKILEQEPLPLAFVNNDGVLTFANEHFTKVLGYTVDDIPTLTVWWERAYPDVAYREQAIRTWETEVRRAAIENTDIRPLEYTVTCKNGEEKVFEISGIVLKDGFLATFIDHTGQKRAEEALKRRLVALTRPLEDTSIAFEDLFDIEEIQRLQDEFATATGVGMLLTRPDGTPITKQSNFCRLCREIVRRTTEGEERCRLSDSELGKYHEGGPYIHTCLSAGLWGAGASIELGGRHIANWLIGQVRDETQTEEAMRAYARQIGADEEEFIAAFHEVPVMSAERFRSVAQALWLLSNQLSMSAYQNVQQARFITERSQAEEALRESEEHYRSLVDSSFDGIAIHQDGIVVFVNTTAARLLGYDDPAGVIGKPALDIIHPDFRPQISLRIQQSLEGPLDLIHEKFLKADGSTIDVDVATTPCRWQGKPAAYVTFRDISGQLKAQEALRESEERLKLFILQAPAALAMFDTEMRYLAASRRWIADYRLVNREILGHSHYEIFPEISEELKAIHRRGLAGEVISSDDDRFEREDGSVQYLSWEVRPWYTTGNVIGGIIIYSEDITDRREAEDALRESEEKYRTAIEKTQEAVIIAQDGLFVFANASMGRLTGLPPAELVGKPFLGFIWPEDRELVRTRHQKRMAGEDVPDSYDFRVLRADGSIRWVTISIARIHWEGRPATLNMLTDITERKQMEESLRESEARLQSILHGSPALQFVIDNNHRLISWNRAIEEYSGIPATEVLGTDRQWRAFYPEKRPVLADLLVDNNTDGLYKWYGGKLEKSRYVEGAYEAMDFFPNMGPDGKWLTFTAAPIRDADGAIIGAVETLEDITDRKRAEDALLEKTEELDQYFSVSLDLLCIADTNGYFRRLNPEWENTLGYPLSELEGKRFLDFVHPDDVKETLSAVTELASQRKVTGFSNRFRHRDGTYRWIEWRSYPKGNMIYAAARDITGRKRTEQELQQSRDTFKAFIDHAYDAVIIHDPDGRVLYVNETMLSMYRITREEALSATIADLSGPENDGGSRPWKEVLEGKDQFFPWQAKRPGDGSVFDVEVYLTRVWIGGGYIILANVRDVTERKRAESALRESEERYKRIFESFVDIYFEIDREGIIRVVSPSVYALGGWKPEELIGKPATTVYSDPSDRSLLLAQLERDEGLHAFEAMLKKRDGTKTPVSINARIRFSSDGQPDGLIGSIHDISGAVKARRDLEESEKKYRHILTNMQDAYFQTDKDGNIIMVNPSTVRLYGYSSEDEMIGLSASSVYGEPGERERMITKLQESGRLTDLMGVGRRKDGSTFWASLNVQFRYDNNGQIIGTEAIVRDISERRRMEDAIQEANKKLNLLNSITRHDVANQLTVLQGYAHMAAIKRPEPVIADLLSKIKGAAETISRQLDFTKTYQELGISSPAWYPLDDVVAKVRSDIVKFSNTCRGHEVFADPMLEKAFFNLFDNAVRHGGNVSEIVVRCERAPDGIVIIVEDDGTGIPPIEKEKIFEKGFGKHTGYGLFLVKEILSITGITIRETGVYRQGARFEILVPKQSHRFVPQGGGKQPQADKS